ncbi:APC family permease [Pseudomonas sp. HK3]
MVSSLFYYAIALAAILQLPLETLIASKAPMADIMKQHSEKAAWLISLISLAAVVNGALVQIIMGSRVLYGMGKQGMAPAWLSTLHHSRKTPYIATLLLGLVVWILATNLNLTTLAKVTSFIIIMVFLLVNISLIKLLRTPSDTDTSSVKVWVPYLGAAMCLVFLSVQLFQLFSGANIATH